MCISVIALILQRLFVCCCIDVVLHLYIVGVGKCVYWTYCFL